MLISSSKFNEEKLKELVEFYFIDVDNFDREKSEVILWNRYLDNNNIKQKSTIEIIYLCNHDLFLNVLHYYKY